MIRQSVYGLIGVLTFAAVVAPASAQSPTRAPVPPFECVARVGYDRDMVLPGYILPTSAGPRTCIPFSSTAARPPAGYKGDFYVDEFTDQKLRDRWDECEKHHECHERVFEQVMKRHPPNKEFHLVADFPFVKAAYGNAKHGDHDGDKDKDDDHKPHKDHAEKDARDFYLLGKVDEKGGDTDLSAIRRPGFFARAPYKESIASDDGHTWIVEFTAPAEAYEKMHEHVNADIRIRGWYMRGAGIPDGKGGRKRTLIVMIGGGGDRIAAIDDPSDKAYAIDPLSGLTNPDDDWPNKTTGAKGMAAWRGMYHSLNAQGYDVLAMDRRGIGISGGYSDTNTLQQGHDILNIVKALRTGEGMRALSPTGAVTKGHDAAADVHGGAPDAGLPVFLMGSSRGTMASSWAMTINFDKDCSYDLPKITCGPAWKDPHIKGAILVADFSSGVGYLPLETTNKDDGRGPGRDRGLFIGGIEDEHNIVFFPSSATLAGISKWPSAFFARGLWCYADGLEGEMDSYSRVNGLKDLVVVRGPHPYETWPDIEKKRVQDRIAAYVNAVVLGKSEIAGRRTWSNMKELVATSSDVWEPSTHPTVLPPLAVQK
jgi:hypothetical protein